ncbi:MAG: response regulator [Bacteroidetes bacterium]|jgi:PAS domain S-box-containing protein|nr:response regulator [Bacteroidota bacterium]
MYPPRDPDYPVDTKSLAILIVEDDEDDFFIARRLVSKATEIEAELEWCRTYEDGLEAILSNTFDIALIDYRLGAENGLELMEQATEQGARIPMILLTGQGDRKVDVKAMLAGASDYLVKWEFDAPLLERSIRYARERERAEQRIREQAALLDKARDAIIATDLDGRVVYWNKSAQRLTGYAASEMIGEVAHDLLCTDESGQTVEEARRVVREKDEWTGELKQRTKEGEEIIVESRWTLVRDNSGEPQSILIINTDITERKELEAQFLRSQRMESVGRLVSGIAHDLGNLLVPISLGVRILSQRIDDEKAQRTLSMIEQSAERGSNMVEQVLSFARGVEGERVAVQPLRVLEEVERIIDETFPDDIAVVVDTANDLWQVRGDATQLQQVLMNLCVNARDAMDGVGTLGLYAGNSTISEEEARRNIDAEPGQYVQITVCDTGEGIPPKVLDKIFEPFFTTKDSDKGTGLGLSTVYSIVKGHGGFIDVDSTVGKGTTFRVCLPAAAEQEESTEEETTGVDTLDGEGRLVLLVDDEPFIRETGGEILKEAGFRVQTAKHGAQALTRMGQDGEAIDVVLTDLMMPEMDGRTLIRKLRATHPDLPIVAMSGVADVEIDTVMDEGADAYLAKPFTAEKLQEALHAAVTARAAALA